jgi:hypothetical protein
MEEEISRKDIRRLLKRFGVEADEAMIAHLARNPDIPMLRVRLVLQDLTDYGPSPPEQPLHVTIEDNVQRSA